MMPDIDRYGIEAIELAQRLARYQRNRVSLFEWMHSSWLGMGFSRSGALTGNSARLAARGAHAWLLAAGVPVPPLAAFRGSSAVLGTLPLPEAMRALRLRALFFRRAELRYWVDRDSRARLAGLLGPKHSEALRWLIETPKAPTLDRLMRDHAMKPLDYLDEQELAWEGGCHFERDGLLDADRPAALLRYAWDRAATPPVWMEAAAVHDRPEDAPQVVRRIALLFGSKHGDLVETTED